MNSSLVAPNMTAVAQELAGFLRESFLVVFTKNIVAVLVWMTLSLINSSMVGTFLKHSLFYEDPRYIMFIAMVINDTVQLTLVTTLYVISYLFFKVHASACCVLVMVAVLTTRCTPFILAGMAVERYTAICFPLHNQHICTVGRTVLLIGAILLLSWSMPMTDLFITLAKKPLGLFHSYVFCDHSLLFTDPSIYLKNLAFDAVFLSFIFLTLFYTYFKIVLVARAASGDLQSVRKARNTVLLHGLQLMLCMLAFVVPSMQALLIQYFPKYSLEIRYVNFLLVYIIPRFLSPMIYGFRDEKFRKYWVSYIMIKNTKVHLTIK
ncbi:odorant receptor 131-2-like isoform X2 [Brienomyrus brachyistius]|nr:odorant receptor 131-2-like isoform X2 [Brienomyrus brachyistius]